MSDAEQQQPGAASKHRSITVLALTVVCFIFFVSATATPFAKKARAGSRVELTVDFYKRCFKTESGGAVHEEGCYWDVRETDCSDWNTAAKTGAAFGVLGIFALLGAMAVAGLRIIKEPEERKLFRLILLGLLGFALLAAFINMCCAWSLFNSEYCGWNMKDSWGFSDGPSGTLNLFSFFFVAGTIVAQFLAFDNDESDAELELEKADEAAANEPVGLGGGSLNNMDQFVADALRKQQQFGHAPATHAPATQPRAVRSSVSPSAHGPPPPLVDLTPPRRTGGAASNSPYRQQQQQQQPRAAFSEPSVHDGGGDGWFAPPPQRPLSPSRR